MPTDEPTYELLQRVTTALESIAASLFELVEQGKPHVHSDRSVLEPISGLDDLADSHPAPGQAAGLAYSAGEAGQVDAASLAREAEELLNAAATPSVAKAVEVGEGEKPEKPLLKINLFHQDRSHDIMDLLEIRPDDEILKRFAVALREGHAPGSVVEIEGEAKVWAAAIELVYTHLPHDLWGSEAAAKAVKQFVDQHSDEA